MVLLTKTNRRRQAEERRKHWRDRRVTQERRSRERIMRSDYECRSGVPRRSSDVGGELTDGEIWWQQEISYL